MWHIKFHGSEDHLIRKEIPKDVDDDEDNDDLDPEQDIDNLITSQTIMTSQVDRQQDYLDLELAVPYHCTVQLATILLPGTITHTRAMRSRPQSIFN